RGRRPAHRGSSRSRSRSHRRRPEHSARSVHRAHAAAADDGPCRGTDHLIMKHVVIVGTGLIGSSFGLALRRAGYQGAITGVSSPRAAADALAAGAIDHAAPLGEAVPQADLVFLSQTIGRILDTIRHIDPLLQPGPLVTDAG